jgi:hypothetical protein
MREHERLQAVLFRSNREPSNDGTADSADESRCAAAADPGGRAHSDKNRNALSDSVIDHIARR